MMVPFGKLLNETPTHRSSRTSRRCFVANGVCWGLGNGLVSSSLIVYLANDFGMRGLAVSLILASPRLVGVLRLATPWLLRRRFDRRRFCCAAYLASAAVLAILPFAAAPGVLPTAEASLAMLVGCWTSYHLLEFVGTVALWDWIGRVVPERIRGRFVGRRNAWLNLAQVSGMLLGAAATTAWNAYCVATNAAHDKWLGYATCAVAGAGCFALATLPLRYATAVIADHGNCPTERGASWLALLSTWKDWRFRRFLLYGSWFSLANGLTGSAQFLFQLRVLHIGYATRLSLDGTSQALQSACMPRIGSWLDRRTNAGVLAVSQLLVACGLIFFVIATPQRWWWIAGAYLFWIAYAGINVGMPKLMLSLSEEEHYASYAAMWFAWTQLVYALSVLAGGLLLDWAGREAAVVRFGSWELDHFRLFLAAGVGLRLLAVPLAARIVSGSSYTRVASPPNDPADYTSTLFRDTEVCDVSGLEPVQKLQPSSKSSQREKRS